MSTPFSDAVKHVQTERGSRTAYARVEARGGFPSDITDELREFLTIIDTAFLATASADGQPYIQHRGGPPGFIRAIDDHTLAFADLTGNRQYVSTGNLTENPKVCLFLIDYATQQRVKVWGTARMVPVADAPPGLPIPRKAEQVFLLTVTAWDVNCSQHIPRKINVAP
jgi:predicted pyridoxine 5'-phosphate oxidase superfamily flavin-nucleotide-binding protein